MSKTHILLIRGRVQGVGYRQSMRDEAVRLGCTGWVRNRTDGSVEAIVQGPEATVEELIVWSRRGPPAARVDRVERVDLSNAAQSEFQDFGIKPTG
jgi:acylphosphatase